MSFWGLQMGFDQKKIHIFRSEFHKFDLKTKSFW